MSTLEVRNLTKDFTVRSGLKKTRLRAANDISFTLEPGRTIAIVGESGSGKSTVARMIAKLETPSSGEILLDGAPSAHRGASLAKYRHDVQMVFQDPYGSLHPRQTVDRLLLEPLVIHGFDDVDRRIARALDEVGLGSGFRFRYSHQLSGGQRQRVAIARALIVEPKILLLDEPTSALDASIQAEILNLLEQARRDRSLTFVMVSHDLGVISHMCERVAVMKGGQVVETVPVDALEKREFSQDYTRRLLAASEGFRRD